MAKTDIIIGVLALLAVINGLRAGVIARLFAWVGIAAGFLALSYTVPLVDEFANLQGPARAWLFKVAVGVMTVVAGALIGTLVGRMIRGGARLTPLSFLDRVGGVLFSLAVIAFATALVFNAAAGLSGGIGDDVRRSYSYSQMQRFAGNAPQLFDLLRLDQFNNGPNDSEDSET
ncbi:MAG: CvpA family protein [Nitriliruptoraceae bacterium]